MGGVKQIRDVQRVRIARGTTAILVICLAIAACQPNVAPDGVQCPAPSLDQEAAWSAPYQGGVAATSEAEAARTAATVLERGGNAVDAAAAAAFVLNVVEPESSGIGGGGFMMIYLAACRQTVVVDSRETAPAAATPDMFLAADGKPLPIRLASTTGLAVGVPGMIRGIALALDRYGTMALADVLAPAIEAAEAGIVVDERLAASTAEDRLDTDCAAAPSGSPGMSPYEAARAVYRRGSDGVACGLPLVPGSRLVQPDLARTLRQIAVEGPSAFYDCAHASGIAQAIVAAQAVASAAVGPRGAGRMTCADLASYRAVVREPVVGTYRGYVIRSAPPPSSGGLAVIQMLRMLERFPLGDDARGFGFGAAATLNVTQEAMRLAFADRAVWMGDTDRVPGLPVAGLVSDAYLRLRSASCDDPNAADGF